MLRTISACALALCASAVSANAGIIAGFSGDRAAKAEFTAIGTQLTVRLTNTSTNDVLDPTRILTAVFFNITGGPVTLTPVSGALSGGSVVLFGPNGGGNVGGEFAYRSNITTGPAAGLNHGISSAGFGIFGPGDRFPGPDLDPPANPNGMNYGIVSAGDNISTGNSAVTGGFPLIKNEVLFTFTCPNGFDASRITEAYFQYGTALDEGGFQVPTPGAAALMGLGMAITAGRRRR
jgi:hypothetical protein